MSFPANENAASTDPANSDSPRRRDPEDSSSGMVIDAKAPHFKRRLWISIPLFFIAAFVASAYIEDSDSHTQAFGSIVDGNSETSLFYLLLELLSNLLFLFFFTFCSLMIVVNVLWYPLKWHLGRWWLGIPTLRLSNSPVHIGNKARGWMECPLAPEKVIGNKARIRLSVAPSPKYLVTAIFEEEAFGRIQSKKGRSIVRFDLSLPDVPLLMDRAVENHITLGDKIEKRPESLSWEVEVEIERTGTFDYKTKFALPVSKPPQVKNEEDSR